MKVLDLGRLDRIAEETDGQEFVAEFAACYRRMLAGRIDRIRCAVTRQDTEAAMDATLSLKISSLTVGACELADLALEVEMCLCRPDLSGARRQVALLGRAAERVDLALVAFLGASEAC